MAIIAAEALAKIRRIEALSARAWPAAETRYNGTWAIRITPDHTSERLNCITPLDPDDNKDMDHRIIALSNHAFRLTPLAPSGMNEWFAQNHWQRCVDVNVMIHQASTTAQALPQDFTIEPCSPEDYVNLSAFCHQSEKNRAGFLPLLQRIHGQRHCLGLYHRHEPVGCLLMVEEYGLCGCLDYALHPAFRGQGLSKTLFDNCLFFATQQSARHFWLQVETSNIAAKAVYSGLGFQQLYSYHIWKPNHA